MPLSSCSHSRNRAWSDSTAVAMAAPWPGGDEYMALMTCQIAESYMFVDARPPGNG